MILNQQHHDKDNPPNIPMIMGKPDRKSKEDLSESLADCAVTIQAPAVPTTHTHPQCNSSVQRFPDRISPTRRLTFIPSNCHSYVKRCKTYVMMVSWPKKNFWKKGLPLWTIWKRGNKAWLDIYSEVLYVLLNLSMYICFMGLQTDLVTVKKLQSENHLLQSCGMIEVNTACTIVSMSLSLACVPSCLALHSSLLWRATLLIFVLENPQEWRNQEIAIIPASVPLACSSYLTSCR